MRNLNHYELKVGDFLREKKNYLEYWREFNIIRIIENHSFPTGKGYRVNCCRKGNNGRIFLAKHSICQRNIRIGFRFKKAEINYVFKWMVEYLRDGNFVIEED